MGNTQSVLEKKGYTILRKVENGVIATDKDGDQFVIKEIKINEPSDLKASAGGIFSEVETLLQIDHPHVLSHKNSFQDDTSYYVVMDHCEGGNLAQKIKERKPFSEEQIMDWFVKICMALKHVHELGLLHRDLRPQNIFLTKFGTLCLGDFGRVNENASQSGSSDNGMVGYLGPEILTGGIYDTKSDIWSLGCVLYELCMLQSAFTAASTIKLIPKILVGPYPSLPESFSPDLHQLLSDIFQQDPTSRPSAGEILAEPFIISFLTKKNEKTVEELQTNLNNLRTLADGLESVHQGTTIGSLTGGVIGAAGGITSIVGLILAPFTLGASLIVTGVGIGVAVAGGATAGVSNITNMVNQYTDRKAITNIIKEFQEKMNSLVTSLQNIAEGLETYRMSGSFTTERVSLNAEKLASAGARVGRGLGSIPELVRLVQVASIGKVAAQTARAVRVAEMATGIFSAFFVAVDIFFIAMDAKEIHNIRQAKAEKQSSDSSKLHVMDTDSTTKLNPECEEPKAEVKSETMKFTQTIRHTADQLQESLDELRDVISFIPKRENCHLDN
ncbi:serine/threonine-protein kinase PLK4 [Salmo trutta]|uniref:non-specific serine/threonine protein kinase n=1 Tax=Salmo trutta TaxID=8032 RepID=A0A673VWR8_SALTR|nr:serine/threonine-protein kinase PLK4-like [Salmo trutta]XP_029610163.1 serine/threonine-protein kinase PLK4-like [Salmo trutta]XP_029610164.1 serine/threonine-protein kinase PLK4-like [Salmo trutta]